VNLCTAWLSAFSLPDRRPIWEWAEDSIAMPPGLTKRDFDPSVSRHFLPIFDALADDHVRQVVIRKPLRGGGTLLSDIWHCWCRENDPGPAMAILQSDEMAKDHFQDRLRLMMQRSPSLARLLPNARHAVTNCEIKWPDGLPFYISGPGINKLQTKSIRYMSIDECWLLKPGVIAEAEGRLGDFIKTGLSKLLLISQGGTEDEDFDRRDREGTREEWEVQCLSCKGYFQPRFTHKGHSGNPRRGIRWDEHKDAEGQWDIQTCLPSVRYECPLCGHPHADGARTKSEWNRTGRYTVTNPKAPRSKRSFHWPGTIDWPWAKLVEFYLTARNDYHQGIIEPTIQFVQKYLAESQTEKTMLDEGLELRSAGNGNGEFKPSPDEFRCLCNDRQAEGLYWSAMFAISQEGRLRLCWYGKLYGAAAIKAKADELLCDNVSLDSGFEAKGDGGVYSTCCRYHSEEQRWFTVKGSDERFFWHQIGKGKRVMRSYAPPSKGDPEQGARGEGQRYATLIRFAAPVLQERLDRFVQNGRLAIEEGLDPDEFKRHLGAEYRKQKRDKFTGKAVWKWVCPSGMNHLRDCAVQGVLIGTMAGVLPDQDLGAE